VTKRIHELAAEELDNKLEKLWSTLVVAQSGIPALEEMHDNGDNPYKNLKEDFTTAFEVLEEAKEWARALRNHLDGATIIGGS
jgi:hypothetical protein